MIFLNGLDRSPYNIGFVKRECFDNPIEIEFEGHKFLAPRDVKGVLDYCYGKDHIKYLPLFPKEMRKKYEKIFIVDCSENTLKHILNEIKEYDFADDEEVAVRNLPINIEDTFDYCIWGVCMPNSYFLYEEMQKRYPNARICNNKNI